MSHTNRVVLLIDMDCFYCQVEEGLNPSLKGKPVAVVQYNEWRGGGIIAVNYPARDKGVTRHMRGFDAKEKCPEIELVKVPQVRGKADLSKYRDAGKRVADVLQTFTPSLERASVDEAYLDITQAVQNRLDEHCDVNLQKLQNTFVVGSSTGDFVNNVTSNPEYNESNLKLAIGGIIAEEIRAEVYKVTGYRCSAGVAHNKILAKLVCGLHKPNKQTILPQEAILVLYKNLPIRKIKSLGGKFGNSVAEELNIEHMGDLLQYTQKELAKKFDDKAASWLFNIARGIDLEPVNTRLVSKSIGCCKRFPGKTALLTKEDIQHWLNELAQEISERLEKDLADNNRRAKNMTLSFSQEANTEDVGGTRTHLLNSYQKDKIVDNAFKIVQKNCMKPDGSYIVTFLGISVSNFQDVKNVKEITSFFKNMRENSIKRKEDTKPSVSSLKPCNAVNTKYIQDSIFSDSTDEDDSEHADYIYYEQLNPDSVVDQEFVTDNEVNDKSPDSSSDSISQEIASEVTETSCNSFFAKYFINNVRRDFNTSKTLERETEMSKSEEVREEVEIVSDNICDIISDKQDLVVEGVENEAGRIFCPDCKKSIDPDEYQSHMDYHFAINLVKNEAHLYKPTPQRISPNKPSSSTKNTEKHKKKLETNTVKTKPIGDYFKNGVKKMEIEEEEGKMCFQCRKRIREDDWEIHMDYHAAKKLHLEINVQKSSKIAGNSLANSKSKGQQSLAGFFKRS